MQTTPKVFGSLSALVFFAACAAPAPTPIQQQPVYGKYGAVIGCEGPNGTVVPCQPPEECDNAAGADCIAPQLLNGNGGVPGRPNAATTGAPAAV